MSSSELEALKCLYAHFNINFFGPNKLIRLQFQVWRVVLGLLDIPCGVVGHIK
jgi:hypothetical protein